MVAVMGDVFILVYNFHVPLALKVRCPSSGVGCDIPLVFIFLCIDVMAIFVVIRFSQVSFLLMCILLFLSLGVVCLGCWWSYVDGIKNPHHLDLTHATGCRHPNLRLSISNRKYVQFVQEHKFMPHKYLIFFMNDYVSTCSDTFSNFM
jgi:hypothetical protein